MLWRRSPSDTKQQEKGPHHAAELAERPVQAVLTVVAAELAQEHRGQHLAGLDRQDHLHHVLPVRLDELPVHTPGEQRVDMTVPSIVVRSVGHRVVPGPHARQELDAEQVRQPEHRLALAMSVGVHGVELKIGAVLQQPVEYIDRLPDTAGNEVAEQRDVGSRDVVVRDAAIAPVANVLFSQEVVFAQFHVRSIGDGDVWTSPETGKIESSVLVDDVP
jgi:hypothetical protein